MTGSSSVVARGREEAHEAWAHVEPVGTAGVRPSSVVAVSQACTDVETHQLVHFERVVCCHSHFLKTVCEKMALTRVWSEAWWAVSPSAGGEMHSPSSLQKL